jgi:hypothetical protein
MSGILYQHIPSLFSASHSQISDFSSPLRSSNYVGIDNEILREHQKTVRETRWRLELSFLASE